MGNKYSTFSANEDLAEQKSLVTDKDNTSNILLGDTYYSCSTDSDWVLINQVDDSDIECSSVDEVFEEPSAGILTDEYSSTIDRSISNIGENPFLNHGLNIGDKGEQYTTSPGRTVSDDNNTQYMSPIEEILKNLSPIDNFVGIEDDEILIYSSDEMSNESSVSSNISEDPDPTLIFENMNEHRSPLEIIFEDITDDETSLLDPDIELPSTFSFNEYDLSSDDSIDYKLLIHENVFEDIKHDDKLFTELLLNVSTDSIEGYCSDLNSDIFRLQYRGVSEPKLRYATSGDTCINELDEYNINNARRDCI